MNTLNKDIITQTLQEILAENPNYFFPNQFSILTWKSKKTSNALITKVNGRRYLGLLRQDQYGNDYWKYKPLISNPEQSGEDNTAKFQQRQEPVKDYGKPNNSEPAVNQQSN